MDNFAVVYFLLDCFSLMFTIKILEGFNEDLKTFSFLFFLITPMRYDGVYPILKNFLHIISETFPKLHLKLSSGLDCVAEIDVILYAKLKLTAVFHLYQKAMNNFFWVLNIVVVTSHSCKIETALY